jgi:glycine/D-amino acid oxidase-like deaminating enzyme
MEVDALIIGGGFYGCHAALTLKELGLKRVHIVERESGLMRRASFVNQARVHNGYHYPRSLPTALRSRENFHRFTDEYAFAVVPHVTMLYAIATQSRVTASQFAQFCQEIGAPCREDVHALHALFDTNLIEACFTTQEIAFNADLIAKNLALKLAAAKVECHFNTSVRVENTTDQGVQVSSNVGTIQAKYVLNCTYADLDTVGITVRQKIKKELTEIALIDPPHGLKTAPSRSWMARFFQPCRFQRSTPIR